MKNTQSATFHLRVSISKKEGCLYWPVTEPFIDSAGENIHAGRRVREKKHKKRNSKIIIIGSPPEPVLFQLVGSCATDNKGIIQALGHFLMQLVLRVQVIQAGHQLVESMPQSQSAARRLRGIAGNAV